MGRRWRKKGLIYSPLRDGGWRDNSALTPTPLLLSDDTIRIYTSFRDPDGIGRIGYVDVDADNPASVIGVSEAPVLDIGKDGMFDDNGVILGDVVRVEEKVYLYYVGFQKVLKAKFLAYSGLAVSDDNGDSFARIQQTPVMDRHQEGLYIRAIHSVIYEPGLFRVWYSVGCSWQTVDGVGKPAYEIYYAESKDGITFERGGISCLENDSANLEYRIGRPRVRKDGDRYAMNFTYGTTDGKYLSGYASSSDGIHWDRNDSELGLELSEDGWDSKHLCYPAEISVGEIKFVFYNGNNMGEEGFGWAEQLLA